MFNNNSLRRHKEYKCKCSAKNDKISSLEFDLSLLTANSRKSTSRYPLPTLQRLKNKYHNVLSRLNSSLAEFKRRSKKSPDLFHKGTVKNDVSSGEEASNEASPETSISEENPIANNLKKSNSDDDDLKTLSNSSSGSKISSIERYMKLTQRMENKSQPVLTAEDLEKYVKLTSRMVNQNQTNSSAKCSKKYVTLISCPLKKEKKVSTPATPANENKYYYEKKIVKQYKHNSGCIVSNLYLKINPTNDINPFPNYDIIKGFQFVNFPRGTNISNEFSKNVLPPAYMRLGQQILPKGRSDFNPELLQKKKQRRRMQRYGVVNI